tara:strand:- start:19 stop:300 length:282 start_codon:yes stop_codon:yes gene_type:complete
MSKSLDRVLQPDGSYKWQETELIHSTKTVKPVVEPKTEEVVITEEPVVEKTTDFEAMTKAQLEAFGRTIGLELDKRHTKAALIAELKKFTSPE